MQSIKKSKSTEFSRWIHFDSESKASLLPLTSEACAPLRELGVALAGKDILESQFRAGSTASATHLVWFVTKGRIQCEHSKGTCTAQAGEWFICAANKPHFLELRSRQAAGLWFHIHPQPRWEHLRAQEGQVRSSPSIPSLQHSMQQLSIESNSPAPLAESMALHYSELIALMLRRELSPSSNNHQAAFIQKLSQVWSAVEEAPADPWTTETLASKINVSSSYLYKVTERYYKTSPMKLVLRLRMRKAIILLTHTDLPIEAIANEVGYQTAYAFSNVFVRHQGIRPGAYRKQILVR